MDRLLRNRWSLVAVAFLVGVFIGYSLGKGPTPIPLSGGRPSLTQPSTHSMTPPQRLPTPPAEAPAETTGRDAPIGKSPACPSDAPFRCVDNRCVPEAKDCIPLVRCPSGFEPCRRDPTRCVPIGTSCEPQPCPNDARVRCRDDRCVPSEEDCRQ